MKRRKRYPDTGLRLVEDPPPARAQLPEIDPPERKRGPGTGMAVDCELGEEFFARYAEVILAEWDRRNGVVSIK